jgi:hypothetical protein
MPTRRRAPSCPRLAAAPDAPEPDHRPYARLTADYASDCTSLRVHLAKGSGIDTPATEITLAPYYREAGLTPRYHQDIAINAAIEAIICGKHQTEGAPKR